MTITPTQESIVNVIDNKTVGEMKENIAKNSISVFISTQWKAILTELISTGLLVFFGCMSCIPIDGFSPHPPMYAPIGFGLTVLINVQIFGHISGAHMNPAVTIVAVLRGLTSIPLGVAYAIVQCIGATLGFGILTLVSPKDLASDGICVTLPHADHTVVQALFIEIILTAGLALVCCSAWDPENAHKQDSMPLKFGFVIAGLSIVGGPLTGASMNPARSLGPAVWTSKWFEHWIYWVGPIVGALVGVGIYWIITPPNVKQKKKLEE